MNTIEKIKKIGSLGGECGMWMKLRGGDKKMVLFSLFLSLALFVSLVVELTRAKGGKSVGQKEVFQKQLAQSFQKYSIRFVLFYPLLFIFSTMK